MTASPDRAGLERLIEEAEKAVRDHEAEPYPDRPEGGWYWTRDAAHLGGIVVGLKRALAATGDSEGDLTPEHEPYGLPYGLRGQR